MIVSMNGSSSATMPSRIGSSVRAADLYHNWCWRCHGANGIAGGVNPDLRESAGTLGEAFVPIVADGIASTSMPAFAQWLSLDEIREIQSYLAALPRD